MAALVTGAGKRLGRAMALYLAERGHDVAVHYASSTVDAEAVADEIRAMGRRAVTVQAHQPISVDTPIMIPISMGDSHNWITKKDAHAQSVPTVPAPKRLRPAPNPSAMRCAG